MLSGCIVASRIRLRFVFCMFHGWWHGMARIYCNIRFATLVQIYRDYFRQIPFATIVDYMKCQTNDALRAGADTDEVMTFAKSDDLFDSLAIQVRESWKFKQFEIWANGFSKKWVHGAAIGYQACAGDNGRLHSHCTGSQQHRRITLHLRFYGTTH